MRTRIALLFLSLSGCVNLLRADGFLYSNGVFTPLYVPGEYPLNVTPRGINDAGQIVGSVYSLSLGGERGFLDSGGAFTILNAPNGNYGTDAFGINNAGEIVGSAREGFPTYIQTHGFVYDSGTYTTIDFQALAPGQQGGTTLTGINNRGQIVGIFGVSVNRTNVSADFLYANGNFTTILSPGGLYVLGINDAGQIVGYDPNNDGFLYTNGVFTTIHVPGDNFTVPTGINNAGDIVGWFEEPNGKMHGFLETDGVFTTIDTPYAGQVSAPVGNTQLFGINDDGEIVGTGPFPPTPEPAPVILTVLGLGGVAGLALKARSGRFPFRS